MAGNGRVKLLVLGVAAALALTCASAFAQGHFDGALPPTEAERREIDARWPKVIWVSPNELGLKRINAERPKKGLPEWKDDSVMPMGTEVFAVPQGEPLALSGAGLQLDHRTRIGLLQCGRAQSQVMSVPASARK